MPGIGDPAPQFSLADVITGQTHALSNYAGKVVLLIFSGPSWCAPCQFEAPILEEIWQTFQGSFSHPKVQLLMISVGETADSYKNAVQTFGLTFPALLNPNNSVAGLYGASAVPTLFVLDTEQKICAIHEGAGGSPDAMYETLYGLLIGCGAGEPNKGGLDLSKWRAVVTILFGVIQDGGGLAITPGGRPIPIDPWGPLMRMAPEKRDLYTNLAIAELTNSLRDVEAGSEIRAAALRSAEAAMRTIVAKGTVQAPAAGKTVEAVNVKRKR